MSVSCVSNVLQNCTSKGIKLCAAIAAAGLIAARSSKELLDQEKEKYAVVTLIDCRSALDPPLTNRHVGNASGSSFYPMVAPLSCICFS